MVSAIHLNWAQEVEAFLSHLAVEGKVSASTQNQALSALLFLYKEVLLIDLPWLDNVVRAKRPQRLPCVLTRTEVPSVLTRMSAHLIRERYKALEDVGLFVGCAGTQHATQKHSAQPLIQMIPNLSSHFTFQLPPVFRHAIELKRTFRFNIDFCMFAQPAFFFQPLTGLNS